MDQFILCLLLFHPLFGNCFAPIMHLRIWHQRCIGRVPFIHERYVFYCGSFPIFLLMFTRLYYSFRYSALAVPKWGLYAYIIALFILVFLNCGVFIVYPSKSAAVLLFILACCDVLLGLFLIHSFIRRLFVLVVMQREELKNEHNLSMSVICSADIELNERQGEVLQTMTKYTLLCTTAIITLNIHFVATAAVGIRHHTSYSVQLMMKASFIIVLQIELLTVYLTFSFAKPWYYKICACCDAHCQSLCQYVAERKIKKEISDKYHSFNDL
eukprot:301112_1